MHQDTLDGGTRGVLRPLAKDEMSKALLGLSVNETNPRELPKQLARILVSTVNISSLRPPRKQS